MAKQGIINLTRHCSDLSEQLQSRDKMYSRHLLILARTYLQLRKELVNTQRKVGVKVREPEDVTHTETQIMNVIRESNMTTTL